MGSMLFIMAIMGCGDVDAVCREVRVSDMLYPTAEACQAATGIVLGRNTDLDFPVVEARCRAEKADSARLILATARKG